MGNVTFHITITMLHAERQIVGLYCIITSSGTQLGSNWIFYLQAVAQVYLTMIMQGCQHPKLLIYQGSFHRSALFFPNLKVSRFLVHAGQATKRHHHFLLHLLPPLLAVWACGLCISFPFTLWWTTHSFLTDLSVAMQLMGSTKELHNRPVV